MNLPEPDAPLCASGKHPFRTRDEALAGLRSARFLRRTNHTGYRPGCIEEDVYECGVCRWWHLTSSRRPRRRGDFQGRDRRRR